MEGQVLTAGCSAVGGMEEKVLLFIELTAGCSAVGGMEE